MSQDTDKAARLLEELRAISRQRTMVFTKATEDSPTIAEVCDTAARTIDRLTAALAEKEREAKAWKDEAAKFMAWFDAPHSKGGQNLDWFDQDVATGKAMLEAMMPLEYMVAIAPTSSSGAST